MWNMVGSVWRINWETLRLTLLLTWVVVISLKYSLLKVRSHWYPIMLLLQRFMIAVAKVTVNHDGRCGTAPDPLIWDQGVPTEARKLDITINIDLASLPCPLGFLSGPWIRVHGGCISGADVAAWPYSVGILCKFTSFLGTLHWPSGSQDMGHVGVSFRSFSAFLSNGLEVTGPQNRANRPILIPSVPVSEGIEIRHGCQFLSSLARALAKLPGGISRFLPCGVGSYVSRLRHLGWNQCSYCTGDAWNLPSEGTGVSSRRGSPTGGGPFLMSCTQLACMDRHTRCAHRPHHHHHHPSLLLPSSLLPPSPRTPPPPRARTLKASLCLFTPLVLLQRLAMSMAGGDGATSARRRTKRQLRSFLRHKELSVKMALARALNHSAQRVEAPREGVEHEKYVGPRAQKPPLPRKRSCVLTEPVAQVGAVTVGFVAAPGPLIPNRFWRTLRLRQWTRPHGEVPPPGRAEGGGGGEREESRGGGNA